METSHEKAVFIRPSCPCYRTCWPAHAINLDSEHRPCVKDFDVKKGEVIQIPAYDYEYVQLPDSTTFDVKDNQGRTLKANYDKAVNAYVFYPPNTAEEQTMLYLTAQKTANVSSLCLHHGL